MYCRFCGAQIDENEKICPNCGAENEGEKSSLLTPPRNEKSTNDSEVYYEAENTTLWIILGVLSALFCCLIGGIVTTVYAAKASGCASAGDAFSASENIKKAKGWFTATVAVGIVMAIIGFMTY